MADLQTQSTPEIPQLFVLGCSYAISVMRGAGLNDAQIACVIEDVRSHALNEEFRRLKNLLETNPPHHHTWGDVMRRVVRV